MRPLVFAPAIRLTQHVEMLVGSAALERNDVVHDVARAS
jgi:hypothetical protein